MTRLFTRLGFVLALGLGAPATAAAQGYMHPVDAMKVLDGLWGKAYVACDAKAWDEMLSDDLTFIHTGGTLDDKARQMAAIRMCNIESLTSKVTDATLYGDHTVVLTGAMQGKLKNSTFTFDLVYTRVFIRRNDTWQLVAHQSTNAPKPAK